MINSIYPAQIPYNQGTTANAVNIQIFNPTAYGQGFCACQMPNQMAMPMNYAMPVQAPMPNVMPNQANYSNMQANYQPTYQPITQSLYATNNEGGNIQYPQNYNNELLRNKNKEAEAVSTEDKEKVEEEKKPKVQLTDEYIMSLENYLNNSNPKIRLMAAKDVLDRFGEDSSRSTDVALTALLNKIIQDPTETVRFMGLTTLDLGYAKGNDLTVQLLKQIQENSTDSYGEDALLASQILLKMSAGQPQ